MAASPRVARSVVVCLLLGSCSSNPTSEIAEMCSARFEERSAEQAVCYAIVSCALEHPLGAQFMLDEGAGDFDRLRPEFQSFQACFRQRTGDISDYAGT
jgi:hypothetical protein